MTMSGALPSVPLFLSTRRIREAKSGVALPPALLPFGTQLHLAITCQLFRQLLTIVGALLLLQALLQVLYVSLLPLGFSTSPGGFPQSTQTELLPPMDRLSHRLLMPVEALRDLVDCPTIGIETKDMRSISSAVGYGCRRRNSLFLTLFFRG